MSGLFFITFILSILFVPGIIDVYAAESLFNFVVFFFAFFSYALFMLYFILKYAKEEEEEYY